MAAAAPGAAAGAVHPTTAALQKALALNSAQLTTVCGSLQQRGDFDGTGKAALFANPQHLTFVPGPADAELLGDTADAKCLAELKDVDQLLCGKLLVAGDPALRVVDPQTSAVTTRQHPDGFGKGWSSTCFALCGSGSGKPLVVACTGSGVYAAPATRAASGGAHAPFALVAGSDTKKGFADVDAESRAKLQHTATDARFQYAGAVLCTRDGKRLYVADTGNCRIRLIDRSGSGGDCVTTIAGDGKDANGSAGGPVPARTSSLPAPTSLAFDPFADDGAGPEDALLVTANQALLRLDLRSHVLTTLWAPPNRRLTAQCVTPSGVLLVTTPTNVLAFDPVTGASGLLAGHLLRTPGFADGNAKDTAHLTDARGIAVVPHLHAAYISEGAGNVIRRLTLHPALCSPLPREQRRRPAPAADAAVTAKMAAAATAAAAAKVGPTAAPALPAAATAAPSAHAAKAAGAVDVKADAKADVKAENERLRRALAEAAAAARAATERIASLEAQVQALQHNAPPPAPEAVALIERLRAIGAAAAGASASGDGVAPPPPFDA